MELGLSLGDSSRPIREASNEPGLNFNTTLSIGPITTIQIDQQQQTQQDEKTKRDKINNNNNNPLLHQLDLLPKLSFPWPSPSDQQALSSSPNSAGCAASSFQMDLCIYNRGGSLSGSGGGNKRDFSDGEAYDQRASSRASDEDDNGGVGNTRKKLRLSKDQSAFLEESFKEHNTLNPVSVFTPDISSSVSVYFFLIFSVYVNINIG